MKRWSCILALALLLTGCAAEDPPASTPPTAAPTAPSAEPTPSPTETTAPAPPELPQPLTALELDGEYTALTSFGENLLLFGEESLTLLTPDGEIVTVAELRLPLPDSGMLQILEDCIACYDLSDGSVVFLDAQLQELRRVPLNDTPIGEPCLSPDGTALYYCTPEGIRVWDLESDICRTLKLQEGSWLGLTGSFFDGSLLRCRLAREDGTVRTLLISAETGETLAEGDALASLTGSGPLYCCPLESEWIFGWKDQHPQNFLPQNAIPLPQISAAVTVTNTDAGLTLDHYDLVSGLRTASLEIPELAEISDLTAAQGCLWFFAEGKLYRWDPALTPVEDDTVYTAYRYTADDPDVEGLESYQRRAEELKAQYGIDILIWNDVTAVTPEGYGFEVEYLTRAYEQGFAALEAALAQFPEGFLQKAASWTEDGTLHIVLTRRITTPAKEHYATLPGMQYLLGTNAYIALELGDSLEQSFYHGLAHVIDTLVLSNSTALYQWEDLNPSGFSYDNDYLKNLERDGSKYLEGDKRYFISTFSMSYPTEDRATILEYAMLPGNEAAFESKYMQAKLKRICKGLREVFDLEGEHYPWEQYLKS